MEIPIGRRGQEVFQALYKHWGLGLECKKAVCRSTDRRKHGMPAHREEKLWSVPRSCVCFSVVTTCH